MAAFCAQQAPLTHGKGRPTLVLIHQLPRRAALVATLLRSRRRCDACSSRATCTIYQLLQPRQHGHQPFYQWHTAWLCPPCQAPVLDLFRRGDHQVVRIGDAASMSS